MNRLDKIKNEFHFAKVGEVHGDTNIEYLLSIIEQAKKALIVLADDENWNGRTKHNDFRTSGIIEWDGEISPLILAKEALKAIQGDE